MRSVIRPLQDKITDVIDDYLLQKRLKFLIERWIRAKNTIKTHLMAYLTRKRDRIQSILAQLKEYQANFVSFTRNRASTEVKKQLEAVTDSVCIEEICNFISMRQRKYIAELNNQHQIVSWLKETVEKGRQKRRINKKFVLNWSKLPEIPAKPRLDLECRGEDLEEICRNIVNRRQSISTSSTHTKKSRRHPNNRNRGHSKTQRPQC